MEPVNLLHAICHEVVYIWYLCEKRRCLFTSLYLRHLNWNHSCNTNDWYLSLGEFKLSSLTLEGQREFRLPNWTLLSVMVKITPTFTYSFMFPTKISALVQLWPLCLLFHRITGFLQISCALANAFQNPCFLCELCCPLPQLKPNIYIKPTQFLTFILRIIL